MAGKFQGKVALVTGGSSGIGRAAALAFAREGAKVVVASDKDVAGGRETVKMIQQAGGEATFVKSDVTKAAEVQALVNKTVELYGRLDCAYNNAGVLGSHSKFTECTEEMWDRTIDVNLKGVFLSMKYEIPAMLKNGGGAIVNASSIVGQKGSRGGADYTASKFGIVGITKTAALEYAREGIRVNAVCPALISTPMLDHLIGGQAQGPGGFVERVIPLGRTGKPEEVAAAVVWLCSDEASFVTGIAMPVDGGAFAQ
jgi:NAD(P)-dependent dehydrogenase (short-subunit alcohol dehydrogenase family)